WSVKTERAPSADRTLPHRTDRSAKDGEVDRCVGVHEEKHVTARRPRAGVACCSDLPILASNDSGTMLLGDGGRAVGGGVIRNKNLERLSQSSRRVVDRTKRSAEQQLLIVGWNDKGNHVVSAG